MLQASLIAYAGIAAVVIHFLMRVLKSGQVDALLMRMGLPSIPMKAIPWIALSLGLVGGIVDALAQGLPWGSALQAAVMGLLGGAGAVAIHETAVKTLQPASDPADVPKE